jgi:hypothetical protein
VKRKSKPRKPRADKPTPEGRLFPERPPDGFSYVAAHYRRRTKKRKTRG